MKTPGKLIITGAFALSLVLIVFSCTREKTTGNASKNSMATALAREAGDDKGKTTVKCIGMCEGSQAGCGLNWDLRNGTVECSCSGCTMEISNSAAMTVLQENLRLIDSSFGAYLNTTYHTTEIIIDSITMEYDEAHMTDVILITYRIPNSDSHTSIMYAISYNDDYTIDKKIQIDCKATQCDCRERWVVATGSAECTCQQDCTMTITELPEETK